MKSLMSALAFTTAIRLGPSGSPSRWMAAWLWIPGGLAGLIWALAIRLFGPNAYGLGLALTGEAVLTGARPWRGLAKTFDGWATPRDHRSDIRRQPAIGPVGAVFIALAMVLLWAGVRHNASLSSWVWVMPPLWARAAMAWGMSWRGADPADLDYRALLRTTEGGLGSWVPLIVALGLGVVVSGFEGVDVFGASLILTGLFLLWGRKLFGGLNQEIVNAAVIVMEVLALFFLAAFSAPPL
ncbi:adenosylcobinamide-GDP ribazoletransferase [Sulfobacillus harzensis]|uniref:Adenosylcobinamide-GDP ribazoletransferase n=1 Tax=Sulfobacillus harzensis TaxID=2729629 RepID=A0A7Y0L1X4_9FIRM|nr:adenosylcobinamide-GDP ribazoletransferase [Sulfobacillus harzensis]NMP21792.1 adenosylcobinamide-GDP ribazoletransferase [Sulfobacillus harzensis]